MFAAQASISRSRSNRRASARCSASPVTACRSQIASTMPPNSPLEKMPHIRCNVAAGSFDSRGYIQSHMPDAEVQCPFVAGGEVGVQRTAEDLVRRVVTAPRP